MGKPVVESEVIKIGRFEATVNRIYLGIREKEVEGLRKLHSFPDRKIDNDTKSESA